MLSFFGVPVYGSDFKVGVNSSGTFTATLPDSIPTKPSSFTSTDLLLQEVAEGTTKYIFLHAVKELPDYASQLFTFIFPPDLQAGTYRVDANHLDPKTVKGMFTDSVSYEGPPLLYAASSGEFVVSQYSKPNGRFVANFKFKTIGGKEFSGNLDITGIH